MTRDADSDPPVAPGTGRHVVEIVQGVSGSAAVPTRARTEVRALLADGWEVTLVVNDAGPADGSVPDVRVVEAGPRTRAFRRSSLKPLVLGWRARSVIRATRPDVVVVHHPVTAWMVRGEAHRHDARVVAVVHSLVREEIRRHANAHRWATTTLARIGERHLRRMDVVAPVSDPLAGTLTELGVAADRIRVVPNTVDLERFRPGTLPRDIDVLFVGRLSPEKGPQDLVAACAGLPAGTRVTIAGSGRLRTALETQAGAGPCTVEFPGFVAADELAALYRRARVVAVPSLSETFGMVVLEALASGTPVVGSRVGGIPALVEPGVTGWLFEPGDVVALRRAIVAALHSDLDTSGPRARERAEAYGDDSFGPAFSALVASVAGPR